MTIGAIVIDILIFLFLIIPLAIMASEEIGHFIVAISVGIILMILLVIGQFWYFSSTESGKRAIKTQESNFNGGITREVKIYSVDGKIIKEYKGKFDVDYDNDRIIFDDEKGQRHIIYYPTGTIVVDEIKED